MFISQGYRAVVASLDDFYLTAADQDRVAALHPTNSLLRYRGNAGTHDLPLMMAVLGSLREGSDVRVPAYDKALRGGRGDRAAPALWSEIRGRQDIVIIEVRRCLFLPSIKYLTPGLAGRGGCSVLGQSQMRRSHYRRICGR
jgi:D-glycerate 3-kinase